MIGARFTLKCQCQPPWHVQTRFLILNGHLAEYLKMSQLAHVGDVICDGFLLPLIAAACLPKRKQNNRCHDEVCSKEILALYCEWYPLFGVIPFLI